MLVGKYFRLLMLLSIAVIAASIAGCGGSGETASTGDTERSVKLTASATGFGERSVNITPSSYTIALVNFWLIRDDDTEVSIINPEGEDPVYTEADPMLISFTDDGEVRDLLSGIPAGTYKGYKMQILYIEMTLPTIFHLPDIADETDYPDAGDLLDVEGEYLYRLYFNAIDKYWKRDFVVELTANTDTWFWMRRALEDTPDYDNFFISVSSNDHPPGGAAPDSTIDLFSDEDFWGPEEDYDNPDTPIIISSESDVGGVNATIEGEFTIPEELDFFYQVDIMVDVSGTMNYAEDWPAPIGITFTEGVLDLGPGYGSDQYGDGGLHPFLPRLEVRMATSETEPAPDAEPVE